MTGAVPRGLGEPNPVGGRGSVPNKPMDSTSSTFGAVSVVAGWLVQIGAELVQRSQ